MMALRLMPEAWVGQRFRKEQRIAELVFDALFERVHAGSWAAPVCMAQLARQLLSPARHAHAAALSKKMG
jgi:hypothetical protein